MRRGLRASRVPMYAFSSSSSATNTAMAAASGRLRRCRAALLVFATAVLLCAVLYRAALPAGRLPLGMQLVNWTAPIGLPGDELIETVDSDGGEVVLDRVLKEAAMEDKTVILTTLNAAWSSPNSVVDLFIESFRIGNGTRSLLDHLVIVALDTKAYARCVSIHVHCFALITEGVDFSAEKPFMSPGYLKMMWRRIDFLRVVLEMGYNFIFSDADVMWFRNPSPHFNPDGDFQIACDHFVGNAADLQNRPNGGFNYVRSSNRTIEFYKFWYSSRKRHPGYHDQDVLNFIKYDPFIRDIGLKMRFLNTEYFGGICEPSKDLNKVCTMHANCCIGLGRKIHDLRVMLEDWKVFMSLPPTARESNVKSWRVPQNCSLAHFRVKKRFQNNAAGRRKIDSHSA